MTEIITPESAERPLTAEDVQEGDTITIQTGYKWRIEEAGDIWAGAISVGHLDDWVSVRGVIITNIERPAPVKPELPTEPGCYYSTYPDVLMPWVVFTLVNDERGWFSQGVQWSPEEVAELLPLVRLVPEGSEREAALNDAIAAVEKQMPSNAQSDWTEYAHARAATVLNAVDDIRALIGKGK